ncbi:MAG: glycosyltransferase family 9 protein [Gemmatimonadales bacterium]
MSSGFASIEPRAFRKKQNLWLAYASELGAPLLRGTARILAGRPSTPPSEWRSGLILSHTHIGDVLYRTCSLPILRQSLPDCEWTYAVSPASAEVLSDNPHIHEALAVVEGEDSWHLVRGGFSELKSRRFDVVLCSNTLRHYPDLALAAALGIPNRIAFIDKGLSGLVNHPVSFRFPDSYASYFRTMVAAVTNRDPDWPLRPRVYPSAADEARARELWWRSGLDDSKPVVACSLRTRQADGNWPQDVMVSILERARESRDFSVVLCGSASDAPHLRALATTLPFPAPVIAGEAGLLAFAAFLERCAALLTLDSGPRHIGNAAGIPVVFARNLSHSKVEAGRYCDTETDLAPDVEYLTNEETDRITRALSVDSLAAVLLERISVAGRPA